MVMHRVHFRKLALDLKSQALKDTEELIRLIELELGRQETGVIPEMSI